MEIENTFLQVLKDVIEELKNEGIVTQEEIEKGIDIPFLWLASSGIQRDAIITAMRNLYERKHPNNKFQLNRFKKFATLFYSEKDGEPYLEVLAKNDSIIIADEEIESDKFRKYVNAEEFVQEIVVAKRKLKINELVYQNGFEREKATSIVNAIFDEKQIQSDLYAMPHFLKEMAINLGEYYRYLEKKKQEIETINTSEQTIDQEPLEIRGGIIEQEIDQAPERVHDKGTTRDRVSDVYPFEQRDEILKSLEPVKIVKYDGLDRRRQIVEDAHTLYIYRNPNKQDGYLAIVEPLDGDKEVRTFFIERELFEGLQKDEDFGNTWKLIGEEYITMPRSQFFTMPGTCVIKHTGDLETYRQKIKGLVKGLDKGNPQSATVKRDSLSLFGKEGCEKMMEGVTRSRLKKARDEVFGDKSKDEIREGDVTHD